MARRGKRDFSPGPASQTDTPAAAGVPARVAAPEALPIVYKIRGGRRRQRTSRGLRDVQNLDRGLTRSAETLARAAFRGFGRYDRLRGKSARRKKDGAIRDALDNWSRAIGRTLRVASNAPYDFTREVNTKRISRQLRDTVRMFTLPIFR